MFTRSPFFGRHGSTRLNFDPNNVTKIYPNASQTQFSTHRRVASFLASIVYPLCFEFGSQVGVTFVTFSFKIGRLSLTLHSSLWALCRVFVLLAVLAASWRQLSGVTTSAASQWVAVGDSTAGETQPQLRRWVVGVSTAHRPTSPAMVGDER